MSEMERAVSEWPRGPKEMSSFLRSSSLSSNSYTWAGCVKRNRLIFHAYRLAENFKEIVFQVASTTPAA